MGKKDYTFQSRAVLTLEWTGKAERESFQVDTTDLYVHEQVSPKVILWKMMRKSEQDITGNASDLPLEDLISSYVHGDAWQNRLIFGDSLLVMNSLLEKEGLAGQVQMIYLDPPYGIRYDTNFEVSIASSGRKREDKGTGHVRAYRDSWKGGISAYLAHMQERLLLCRELLLETGSIFVQIGPDNVHLVRILLDEVFGPNNYCDTITYQKTSGFATKTLPSLGDYLLWYAKDKNNVKFRPLFASKRFEDLNLTLYRYVEEIDSTRRTITKTERQNLRTLPPGARLYRIADLTSQGTTRGTSSQPFVFEGKTYMPAKNAHWKTTTTGLANLAQAHRIQATRSNIYYVRFWDDFPVKQLGNIWTDTGVGGYTDPKIYAVQTNTKVVQRCIQMTTDPGDIVLDPTCGSGTTAFVAEQWGRRWITCDTSRVAITLARQRLVTAVFP